ncbi:MAG TPA: flagellar biosynthesis anti-sigma factor FlgM [Lachnospiraceae bacterium]|nr:flagellar biosynthesis anti-sigma factor FlgM [Lachnospiraceae bacterium]
MRIEAYTQVQQIYKTSKTDKNQKKAGVSSIDKLQISSIGRDYQVAKQAVAASSDIRDEITAPLKNSIQAGTYGVEAGAFADKLLQRMKEVG